MNNVNIIGRITDDLELRQTPQGVSVCNFCIAVNADKETVYFVDCVAWRQCAENISKYMRKGSKLAINGSLTTRTTEYNGTKRKITEIKVNSVDFFEAKSDNVVKTETVAPNFVEISASDDLPF